jgi:methylmalonyl-CoA mutase N-terminal domain/subunit
VSCPDDFDSTETRSGIPIDPYYGPVVPDSEYFAKLGDPGQFPFTRGNFPDGYRGRLWTFRQYAGFGTAEQSNAHYRYLLDCGGTGLSVAFDLPSQCGFDSDDPDIRDEVGRVGVAVDSLRDFETLFDGIPLDRVSTSMTINGTAAIMLAFYVAAADTAGVPREKLRGTIQNDPLKEYAARGTWIWPVRPSLRLVADTVEFCAAEMPRFNAISVAGAHFKDAGANTAQELAFTLQDAITYCDEVVSRGRMTIDEFAPQVSFFFYTHEDFFEEIAKYRAGRRIWARVVKERYGAELDSSCLFRVGCVCGGASLYAQQPHNNIVRVALETLASALGGVQSIFTAAWDEAFALPSTESATLALRTQQIVAYESGVSRVVDPLGGSWYVESLTDAVEEKVLTIMNNIEDFGGMPVAIELGYIQTLLSEESWLLHQALEQGTKPVVGVNRFTSDEAPPELRGYELDEATLDRQIARLRELKQARSQSDVTAALSALSAGAHGSDNLMPLLIDAAKAYCTVGEMVGVMGDCWGQFIQPAVF